MKTVFIRHKLTTSQEILEDLWRKRLIAVHYCNILSTEPNDYGPPGKKALSRLRDYCQTGVIVSATYSAIKPDKILIGEIVPQSQIIPKTYGDLKYKTVQMHNAQEVSYQDYPVLSSLRPRQGTITGWPSAQSVVEAIFKNTKIPSKVTSLSTGQLEVLCYEYLLHKGLLKALVLPIGRTLSTVDIWGMGPRDENILAQVTFSKGRTEIAKKLHGLKSFQGEGTLLYFFGPALKKIDDKSVRYVSIETVFETMKTANYQLIAKMLGW